MPLCWHNHRIKIHFLFFIMMMIYHHTFLYIIKNIYGFTYVDILYECWCVQMQIIINIHLFYFFFWSGTTTTTCLCTSLCFFCHKKKKQEEENYSLCFPFICLCAHVSIYSYSIPASKHKVRRRDYHTQGHDSYSHLPHSTVLKAKRLFMRVNRSFHACCCYDVLVFPLYIFFLFSFTTLPPRPYRSGHSFIMH